MLSRLHGGKRNKASNMGLQSMTGFGEGDVTSSGISIKTELFSVNRKQLDIQLTTSHNLSFLDIDIQKYIQNRIARGRITANVRANFDTEKKVELDHQLIKQYAQSFSVAAKKANIKQDVSLSMIMDQPGVISINSDLPNKDIIKDIVIRSLSLALKNLKKMRTIEGAELESDISNRLSVLEETNSMIKKRHPKMKQLFKKQLFLRLKEAGLDNLARDESALKEIILFVERSDITEEIIRISSHIKQARSLLRSRQPAGRPFDFLCQELFREINTISAKAPDIQIKKAGVKFKVELERIREQVQNVE